MERFLSILPLIYEILRDARERFVRNERFKAFWDDSLHALDKYGYDDKSFMREDGLFRRQSFAYWRREFRDTEEGLTKMFTWFKSCFGIMGNDDYCCVQTLPYTTYDWNRMRECYESAGIPAAPLPELPNPSEYPDWSEGARRKLQEAKERLREHDVVNKEEATRVLDVIRERNQERGIWQEEER